MYLRHSPRFAKHNLCISPLSPYAEEAFADAIKARPYDTEHIAGQRRELRHMPDSLERRAMVKVIGCYDTEADRLEAMRSMSRDAARDRFILPPPTSRAVQAQPDRLCTYCGRPSDDMESDHIVAKALGGDNGAHNRTPSCRPCNGQKLDKPLLQWLMEIGGGHEA